ncbi:MAG: DUF1080 domain-containing protein [Bryobacteraceae bacterium]|nr:DUF1080 domain-containing protein [Bryobacterales bacterium]NUN02756.1 DUF1080 domain-containing protein [Bryobacteraceae bacterium]
MGRERVSWMFLLGALLQFHAASAQSVGFESLTPRKEVTEYCVIAGTPSEVWSVQDGVIACTGKPSGYLRSKQKYKNYILRAEWRFKTEGWSFAPSRWPNAGFLIHASEEPGKVWPKSFVEVQGHYGEAGSLFSGGIKGAKRGPIVKDRVPFGAWDRYEITSHDGTVRVVLNGVLVNEGWGANPAEGYICLQSEGWPVFYRNIEIKILPD